MLIGKLENIYNITIKLKWSTNLSVRFVTKVYVSLIFSPSNCILGHTSHYQNVPIIWINLKEQRAVFTK